MSSETSHAIRNTQYGQRLGGFKSLERLIVLIVLICLSPHLAFGAVVINEVMANPLDEDTGEFIELFNAGVIAIDVLNWEFTDGDSTDIIQPFDGDLTVIPPGGYALILDAEYANDYDLLPTTIRLTTKNTTLGNGLQINDPITLFDASGTKVIDTYLHPFNPKNGISAERIDVTIGDVASNWKGCIDPSGSTPGRQNSVSGQPSNNLPNPPPNPPIEDLPIPPLWRILISEIMHSPDTKTGQTEWVELFNPNPQRVDLGGWRIEDASGRSGEIADQTHIDGNRYRVFAKSRTDFHAQYAEPVEVVEIKLPALNNSGDTVILYDRANRKVDEMTYTTSGSVRGVSLERVQLFRASEQAENWRPSIALEGATPGKVNSRTQQVKGNPKLGIAPTPFNPRLSGTTLRYETSTEALVTIQIFDAAGRLVRGVLNRYQAGGKQSIQWDGRNEDGEFVPVGVYICQLIVEEDPKTPAMQIAKTIVVAEKL